MVSIVGNSIDSYNKKVLEKMNKMDMHYIEREVKAQIEEGAEYIKLDASALSTLEFDFLKEAVKIVEASGGKALVKSERIDTLLRIIDVATKEIIIGDVEFEKKKIDALLDAVKSENVKIVASTRDTSSNVNGSPEKALLIAQLYVDYLLDHGIDRENILLEPVVQPLDSNYLSGRNFLNTLELFKLDFPNVRTIANLSRLAAGLPQRQVLSAHGAALSIEKGLDFVILNILERAIVESIICTLTIIGKDRNMKAYQNFCKRYKHIRN